MYRIFIFTFLMIGFFAQLCAQEAGPVLSQGLSSKLGKYLYQDRTGVLWIATENGINRYDGNKVKSYVHNPSDSLSINHDFTTGIIEDTQGNIYVSSYAGVQLYSALNDNFCGQARFSDGRLLNKSIQHLCLLPDGSVCASGGGAWRLMVKDHQIIADTLIVHIENAEVNSVVCDDNQNIFLLTVEHGVYRLVNDRPVCVLPHSEGCTVAELRNVEGQVYAITSEHDIYRFRSSSDSFFKLNSHPISSSTVCDICSFDEDQLLVSTDGNSLKLVDKVTGEVTDYICDIPFANPTHLKIHRLLKDRQGNYWLCAYQRGVCMLPEKKNFFQYIGYRSPINDLIGTSNISSICKDRGESLWVGTDGEGLYHLDSLQTRPTSKHYTPISQGGTFPDIIKSIFVDSENNLWIGSYGNGLGRLAPDQKTYIPLPSLLQRNGHKALRIYDFAEDTEHRLWIATLGEGLFCLDVRSGKVIDDLFPYKEINRFQNCLLYTRTNHLYIGTYDGVFCIDLNSASKTPVHLCDHVVINALYEDHAGNLWAGTTNSLIKFDAQGLVDTYRQPEDFPLVSVNSISEDQNHHLWLATNKGLIDYNPEENSFSRFSENDGLEIFEFSKNHSVSDAIGNIYFAADYGIYYFNPERNVVAPRQSSIKLVDLYLNNEIVSGLTLSGGEPVITQPVSEVSEIRMSMPDNSFGIELGTIEYEKLGYANYEYSIDSGVWHCIPDHGNIAFFHDLKAGTYHIKFRRVDNKTVSDPRDLTIVIEPYWWASTWAKLCYLLLFVLAAYLIFKQVKYRMLSRRINDRRLRTIEINEAKLQFFTNISHEIRTPLSLIVSPLHKLMSTDTDQSHLQAYSTMYRNVKMLMQLINQLLDLRKIDNGRLKLVFRNNDIVSRLSELCSYFSVIAAEKNIHFTFSHEPDELFVWSDPGYFDKIFMNLLSNAFKFTPDNGTIEVRLETHSEAEGKQFVSISVTDTGIGINEADLPHIFERFYIADNNKDKGTSNGIGLHLTHSLVKLHHGTIAAWNNENGKGATFVVELPLGREHFRDDEVLSDENPDFSFIKSEAVNMVPDPEPPVYVKPSTPKKMLIIDDDPEIISYLRNELSADFHVLTCSNGKDGLQMALGQRPDVIICDVMMPEMDGITFCKKLKQNVNINHIPVILLTAKTDDSTNLQGLKYGADAYITKPFYIEVVRRTAFNLIGLRSQLYNIYSGQQLQENRQVEVEMESPNQKLLSRIMAVVNENIGNPDLSIDKLCEEVGISRAHIYRKLKELTNQSGRDFIKNIRLKYAEKLLLEDEHLIGEIATKLGYNNPNNFSADFKAKYGMTPNRWRAIHKNQDPGEWYS